MEFYAVNDVNYDLSEKLGEGEGFWAGDTLRLAVTVNGIEFEAAPRLMELNDMVNKPGVVNVYLVHDIQIANAITYGDYYNYPASGVRNPTITVRDRPTLAQVGESLAHELGHVLGLKHSDDPDNMFFKPTIAGTINNMSVVAADPAPYYLMYFSGSGRLFTLLSERETTFARKIADEARQGTTRIIGGKD